ncbi:hypothetical protein [Gracilibacillus salinarum]|uniref:Lipoprotein n=1 Tax=Gracilibacillus salinarum TaxID=2932255 RepID=A0ABY4GH82_9BACI|nr:hypothetical protein [Gracilibacillus salinarum]UOQ83599.1 hypothetical protein MUN87_12620 [Gracilibacillus salinarum]
MKKTLIILISITFLTIGCSNNELNKQYSDSDVKFLSSKSDVLNRSEKLELLNQSDQMATSSVPFTVAKAFFPDDEFVNKITIQKGESFTYLKVPNGRNSITGEIVVENAKNEDIELQVIFMQGNNSVKVRPKEAVEWSRSLNFQVPSKTSISLNVEITIDKESFQEFSFIPIEKVPSDQKLGNETITNSRFFLQLDDVTIKNKSLEEQSFKLNDNEINSLKNLLPTPTWFDENKNDIKFISDKGEFFSKRPVKGIKLDAIPYSTKVDILLFDEYGNSSLIKENVSVEKNKENYISISDKVINDMYAQDMRQYIMVTNNREENILADIRALIQKQKPFPTSYQGILELHPLKN